MTRSASTKTPGSTRHKMAASTQLGRLQRQGAPPVWSRHAAPSRVARQVAIGTAAEAEGATRLETRTSSTQFSAPFTRSRLAL